MIWAPLIVSPSSCASGDLIGPYAQGVKPIEIPLIHLIPEFRKILLKKGKTREIDKIWRCEGQVGLQESDLYNSSLNDVIILSTSTLKPVDRMQPHRKLWFSFYDIGSETGDKSDKL